VQEAQTIINQLEKLETEMPRWGKFESTQWLAYQKSENLFFSKLETFLEGIEGLPAHLLKQFHSIQKDTFIKSHPELQTLKYPRKKEPSGETEWLTPRAEYLHFFYDNLRQWLEEKPVKAQRRKGRPPSAKYESDHISYDEKRCHIQPNSKMAQICKIVLSPDVKVGDKIHWEEVYQLAYEVHEIRDPTQYKQLYLRIADINNKLEREGIPSVFRQEGGQDGHVVRLL
jgi:hypothetical protein